MPNPNGGLCWRHLVRWTGGALGLILGLWGNRDVHGATIAPVGMVSGVYWVATPFVGGYFSPNINLLADSYGCRTGHGPVNAIGCATSGGSGVAAATGYCDPTGIYCPSNVFFQMKSCVMGGASSTGCTYVSGGTGYTYDQRSCYTFGGCPGYAYYVGGGPVLYPPVGGYPAVLSQDCYAYSGVVSGACMLCSGYQFSGTGSTFVPTTTPDTNITATLCSDTYCWAAGAPGHKNVGITSCVASPRSGVTYNDPSGTFVIEGDCPYVE